MQAAKHAAFSAATLAAFPPSIRRALAIPAHNVTGTIMDVQHVVILMQENRSFDHYFGTLKGVRGFGDRMTIPLPNGRTVWQQQRADHSLISPYHLDSRGHNAQRASGTPHTWIDSQLAWDNGRMSRWPVAKTDHSMGYFKEQEIPYQFALANAFTLCDAYHCAIHAGTDPNRVFHMTGTNGVTAQNVALVDNEWSSIHGASSEAGVGYSWKTYAERLEEANVSWISYQNMPDEWGDNILGAFQTFRQANLASGFPVSSGEAPGKPYSQTQQTLPYHAYDARTDNTGNPLYKGIANTLPGSKPEAYLDAFKRDVREGKLPQVSWINAPAMYCEHPGPSSPAQGAWFMQEVLDALTANPEVWSKTVLLINFDENDGYFDHVPSPSAPSRNPDGTYAGKTTLAEADLQAEYFTHGAPAHSHKQPAADGRVYGPGPRVPLYAISPWSRGGWVNSQVFDHTSVLRFLEARFGVMEPQISPFRRALCGDLTSAFNFKAPNHEALPAWGQRFTRTGVDQLCADQKQLPAVPVPQGTLQPQQASGTRPSRALPYELHTSARCQAGGHIELQFANTGTQAALFHVYDRHQLERLPRRYMVEAGKTLSDTWDATSDNAGKYDLWVLGPNGFHRHFRGDLKRIGGMQATPEVDIRYDVAQNSLRVNFLNTGSLPAGFTITPMAYRKHGPHSVRVMEGRSTEQHWELQASGQWYDFAVTCDSDATYYRRFAGRMETGKHSISDPAMGEV